MQVAAAHRVESLDKTLAALADPVRRQVVQALGSGPRRAGDIAALFPLSGPAVSKHLRVLRRCQLIIEDRDPNDARVRLYRLAPEPLQELGSWVDRLRAFWSMQLESFQAYTQTHAEGLDAGSNVTVSAPARTTRRRPPRGAARAQVKLSPRRRPARTPKKR